MPPYVTAPRVANAHLFEAGASRMLLSVEDGRVYPIDESLADALDRAMEYGDSERVALLMAARGMYAAPIVDGPPASVPVRALSLAISQACNLGCTYCYAQQGSFGGSERVMSADVAFAAVDRLIAGAPPSGGVTLAFLGGEPLANRTILRETTAYAAAKSEAAGVRITFAVTTNATLLDADDVEFFDRYGFGVTISIDGDRDAHNLLRPFKSGRGSYDRVVEGARLLLQRPSRRCQVTARVSVTPRNLNLPRTLEELSALGFDGILFSPVLHTPPGSQPASSQLASASDRMTESAFDTMLDQMIACGEASVASMRRGGPASFLNLRTTLQRIHRQKPETYPCGAGGGYMGVSAKGGLFACHRFVDDDAGALGSVGEGVDPIRQEAWLAARHLRAQTPCHGCWARHLCSGGCHYEAMHAERAACDYIRGWLHYCLGVYATLASEDPLVLQRITR